MSEPWRRACPSGHRNLRPRSDGHYCDSCRESYPDAQITDLKQ